MSLLKHVYYGDELDKLGLDAGLRGEAHWFSKSGLPEPNWAVVLDEVHRFFSAGHPVFGGPITAGDAAFIGAFMSSLKPSAMVEIGVASGFSSALILSLAKRLNLLSEGAYLTSLDLMTVHAGGERTGSTLYERFPDLSKHWALHTERTSLDVFSGDVALPAEKPVLAFIDGGHNHPWPAIDLIALWQKLPRNTWVLCQDYQMMERWVMDCVKYGAESPYPVRGSNIDIALWPGRKHIGTGSAFNMAAVSLDVSGSQIASYVEAIAQHHPEVPDADNLMQRVTAALDT